MLQFSILGFEFGNLFLERSYVDLCRHVRLDFTGAGPGRSVLSNVFRELLIVSFKLRNACIKMLAAFRHVYVVGGPAQERHCDRERTVVMQCSSGVRSALSLVSDK
jgi:hypothetical protein